MLATQDLQKAGKKKRNLGEVAMDHSVKMWDMNMNKSRFTFRGHVDSVNSVAW